MKSKAHSKKCQELGVLVSSLVEPDAEEGTSKECFQDPEGQEESELLEEHQFSDLGESDDDDDDDDNDEEEEEEEEEETQEKPSVKSLERKNSSILGHSPRCSPSTQKKSTGTIFSVVESVVSRNKHAAQSQQIASSRPETKWSADSSDVAVCHSFLRLRQPVLTSNVLLTSAEKESIAKPQMLLAMDLSISRDIPPRRKCSPSKDTGAGNEDSNQSVLAKKHLLTKNDNLLKRFSSAGETPSLRSLSPALGRSSCHQMSPRRQTVSLRSLSPKLEFSSSRYESPRRELTSRVYLPPERGVSPVRCVSPSRDVSSTRYSSLKKMFPQSYSEPSSRYPSPVREDIPSRSQSTVDDILQLFGKTERGVLSSMPLPHGSLSKSKELFEEPNLKTESRVPASSPGITEPLCIRPLQSPYEVHVHAPSLMEDHIFSHLPLHSQQLPRSTCPMIPIGGIQMVQARPNSHPSLGCRSVTSLQTGYFALGGNFPVCNKTKGRDTEVQDLQETPSSSATPPLRSSSYLEEKVRTSELQRKKAKEENKVNIPAECGSLQPESSKAAQVTSYPKDMSSPKPLASGGEVSGQKEKEEQGTSHTSLELAYTFVSDIPTQTLDRSSSAGCLWEPSSSPSSCPLSSRRRNLSGEAAPQAGPSRRRSPPLEQVGLGLTPRQVDNNTGST